MYTHAHMHAHTHMHTHTHAHAHTHTHTHTHKPLTNSQMGTASLDFLADQVYEQHPSGFQEQETEDRQEKQNQSIKHQTQSTYLEVRDYDQIQKTWVCLCINTNLRFSTKQNKRKQEDGHFYLQNFQQVAPERVNWDWQISNIVVLFTEMSPQNSSWSN